MPLCPGNLAPAEAIAEDHSSEAADDFLPLDDINMEQEPQQQQQLDQEEHVERHQVLPIYHDNDDECCLVVHASV